MHQIEPYYNWKEKYNASDDDRSPFYGVDGLETHLHNKIYNYLIHPDWDFFGSNTLYLKVLYADYNEQFAIIELMGEWNDCIDNDIMYLKREVIDRMTKEGIFRFILIGENVLNFHGSDDCYYEEWWDDIKDEGGWIAAVNFREHITQEMRNMGIHYFINMGENLSDINWRKLKPRIFLELVENLILKALA